MKGLLQSVGAVTGPASAATSPGRQATAHLRDGRITIRELVDAYMAEYAGRDSSRVQRLGFWSVVLGDKALADLDDEVFHALEDLAEQRGRRFAGRDASGLPILRAQRQRLAPATVNRDPAALSALSTRAQRRRLTSRMDSPSRKCIRPILANMPTLITPGSPCSFFEQGSVFAWGSNRRAQVP